MNVPVESSGPELSELDPGIRALVVLMQTCGLDTYTSCDGSHPGATFLRPTVRANLSNQAPAEVIDSMHRAARLALIEHYRVSYVTSTDHEPYVEFAIHTADEIENPERARNRDICLKD